MNRLYLFLILLLAVIISFYISFSLGKTEERKEWEHKFALAEIEIKNLEAKAPVINEVIITKYVDKIRYIDKVKIQTVKEFITVENDKACVVNKGFVKVHDGAAAAIPVSPAASDAEASAVHLSNVAEVVKDNYAIHQKTKIQLESLQQWIREQQALWNETK